MDQSIAKAAGGGRGLEVVLVGRKIVGHRDQLAADVVPRLSKPSGAPGAGLATAFLESCEKARVANNVATTSARTMMAGFFLKFPSK